MPSDSGPASELVSRLKNGDDQALAHVFSLYRERLKRMVEFRIDRRLQGRVDSSDVLQEAYIDAAQRLRHFLAKPNMSLFVWLRQITTQRLIDIHRLHLGAQLRDAKQEVQLFGRDGSAATSASLAAGLLAQLTSPSQLAARAELVEQVEKALENMDAIDREVLAMRHFEELTNNEVAEVLGLSKAAASNRYVRALARLKDILAKIPGFFEETNTA